MTTLEYVVRECVASYGVPPNPGRWHDRASFAVKDTRVMKAQLRGVSLAGFGRSGWPADQWVGHFAGGFRLHRCLRERREG